MPHGSRRWFSFAAGVAAGAFGAALAARYKEDKRRAITLLLAGSQVAETDCGPMEYAQVGDGPVVLISPGIGGGYDQGLFLAALFRGSAFKFIAVSRPGYLRTPLWSGRTPQEQADAYAALLDVLHIPHAAVLAASTGGPAALQFAHRHPDRCWSLVLASAIHRPVSLPRLAHWAQRASLQSDFLPWLLNGIGEGLIFALNGVHPQLLARIRQDPEKMGILRGMLKGDVTTSLRREGLLNDLEQLKALPDYLLDRLTVPIFVVHCPADPLVPFAQGESLARLVPGARLLAVKEGGHLCLVTHREQTVPEIVKFLARHAPRLSMGNGSSGED